eukprot:TRINITY_DN11622_c0_g1_i1.p1 TRINITY_DN11622_c0_g1~~TRINITY_DN11622_c0_g1_i1.p1  ORF type:complete len:528 (+),score=89.95 TRINITY_DN11622_c0_g1_i1:161-1744(+)
MCIRDSINAEYGGDFANTAMGSLDRSKAAGKTGYKLGGAKLGIRVTESYYDPNESEPRASEDGYAIIGQGRDDRTLLEKAREWWQHKTFWQRILVGAIGTCILLMVISLIAYGVDKGTGIDDDDSTYYSFKSTVPAGCLGAPFILVDFHGGQSKHTLKHHRYNEILKYTRDGCFLGQANQALNTRLRGMRIWGDRLYVTKVGQKGETSNVVRFGGCGKSTAMKQRAVLDEQVISPVATLCNQHMFDLDSFDQGKTLFVSDQQSGTVSRFNGTTGEAISAAGAVVSSCPGLIANWTNVTSGAQGLGLRGLCTHGKDELLMPYKFNQGVVSVTLGGAGAVNVQKRVAGTQKPSQSGVLEGTPGISTKEYPLQLDLYDVQNDSTTPTKYGGIRGWFDAPDVTGKVVSAKPSSCSVVGNKLYLNVRQDKASRSFNGAIEYDVATKKARVFKHSDVGLTQGLLVHGDDLYILGRATKQAGHEGSTDLLSGNIFRFNLTEPDPKKSYLGALVSSVSPSVVFPDQPVAMVLSEC